MIRVKRKRASPFRVRRRRRDRLHRLFVVVCIAILLVVLVAPGAVVDAFSSSEPQQQQSQGGIRLNKVFKATHSRRQADALIAAGRVRVNGVVVPRDGLGARVRPHLDRVELDGAVVRGWEAARPELRPWAAAEGEEEYIKFWKPVGVTCTTDRTVPGNLLDALEQPNGRVVAGNNNARKIEKRIFSVGRLDKDSSGLLLLTSGRTVGSPTRCCGRSSSDPKRTG